MYELDEIMARYGGQEVEEKLLGGVRLGDTLQFDVGSPPVSEQTADTPQTDEDEEVKWDLLLRATATSVLDDAEDSEIHITQDHHRAGSSEDSTNTDKEWGSGYSDMDTLNIHPGDYYNLRSAATMRRDCPAPTAQYGKGGKGKGYGKGGTRFRRTLGSQDLPAFPDLPFGVSPPDYTCPPWRVTVLPNGSFTVDTPPVVPSPSPAPYHKQHPVYHKQHYYTQRGMAHGYDTPTPVQAYGGLW